MEKLQDITKDFFIEGIELDTGEKIRVDVDCTHIKIAEEDGRLRWLLVWQMTNCYVYNVDHVRMIHFDT